MDNKTIMHKYDITENELIEFISNNDNMELLTEFVKEIPKVIAYINPKYKNLGNYINFIKINPNIYPFIDEKNIVAKSLLIETILKNDQTNIEIIKQCTKNKVSDEFKIEYKKAYKIAKCILKSKT